MLYLIVKLTEDNNTVEVISSHPSRKEAETAITNTLENLDSKFYKKSLVDLSVENVVPVYRKVRGYVYGQYQPALEYKLILVKSDYDSDSKIKEFTDKYQTEFHNREAVTEKLINKFNREMVEAKDKFNFDMLEAEDNFNKDVEFLKDQIRELRKNNSILMSKLSEPNPAQKVMEELARKIRNNGGPRKVEVYDPHPNMTARGVLINEISRVISDSTRKEIDSDSDDDTETYISESDSDDDSDLYGSDYDSSDSYGSGDSESDSDSESEEEEEPRKDPFEDLDWPKNRTFTFTDTKAPTPPPLPRYIPTRNTCTEGCLGGDGGSGIQKTLNIPFMKLPVLDSPPAFRIGTRREIVRPRKRMMSFKQAMLRRYN